MSGPGRDRATSRWRRRAAWAALALGAALAGCSTPPPAVVLPSADVIEGYNARTARLRSLWARAVVEIRYTDESGRRRWEQGEGHFQFRAPDRLALSVGKLGETVLYLGCDAERFWLFERGEVDRVAVGRHDNIGAPCADDLGLPAGPREILTLLGVTDLPADRVARTMALGRNGSITSLTLRPARPVPWERAAVTRYALDTATLEPRRIEIFSTNAAGLEPGRPAVVAELEQFDFVRVRGEGGVGPRTASRITIRDAASDAEIRITLYDLADGPPSGDATDDAFDFDVLLDALAPEEVIVLDRDCGNPAL